MPIKLPSFTDALPLTLGEKRPPPNSIKPSEEWDLLPCDAEGWIPHTPGDPMPCDGDLEVEIMTRTEVEGSIPWRPGPLPAEAWEWSANLSPSLQILAWKPVL